MKTEAAKVVDAYLIRWFDSSLRGDITASLDKCSQECGTSTALYAETNPALKALVDALERITKLSPWLRPNYEGLFDDARDIAKEALTLWIGNDSVQAAEPRRTEEGE